MKRLFTLLIGLVALVGTASAWGDLYLICFQNSNWSNESYSDAFKFTCVAENQYRATVPGSYITDGNWYFRFREKDSDSWKNISPESTTDDWLVSETSVSTNWQNSGAKAFYIGQNADAKYVHIYCNWNASSKWEVSCKVVTTQTEYTVAYTNSNSWSSSSVRAYAYNDGLVLTDAWPGTAMSDADGDGIMSITVRGSSEIAPKIIFDNGGSGDGNQSYTFDIENDAVYNYSSKIEKQTVTVNKYGMATFCSQYPLDFSDVTNLKAYRLTYEDDELKKYEVSKVPAGVGVYLEDASKNGTDSHNFSVAPTATATSLGDNLLVGTISGINPLTQASGSTRYILTTNKDASATPKFFKVNSTSGNTLGAGKAYLEISGENSARESLWFGDDETTGINTRLSTLDSPRAELYNLAGQRVANGYKGVVIQNGKKYVK